jgi:hypothetical protein
LKRGTGQAPSSTIQDKKERILIENPKFDAMHCSRYFSHKLLNLAHRAAYSLKCTSLMDNKIDLGQQIEDKIATCAAEVDVPIPNDTLSNPQLKKKEARTRSLKRHFF